MARKKGPGIGGFPSRGEGWWRIFYSLSDKDGERANIVDSLDYIEQKLVFRTIEAGTGLKIEILDSDHLPSVNTPFTHLRLSSTIQEGVEVKSNNSIVGSIPATTLNFGNGFSIEETSPGEIKISITGATSGNPTGQGSIDILEDNITVNSNPITGINFIGVSGAVTETSPGVVDVDLYKSIGYNKVATYTQVYMNTLVSEGQAYISGFFEGDTPIETDVVITINGLVLEFEEASTSDFYISESNLVLNVDNLGFPIEPTDQIKGFYWKTQI